MNTEIAALERKVDQLTQELDQSQQNLAEFEIKLYEEYHQKTMQMKDYIVSRIDNFLQFKWEELNAAGFTEAVKILDAWRARITAKDVVEEAVK